MTRFRIIDEDEAEGALAAVYATVEKRRGALAEILKVHSLLPKTLEAHLELYDATMFSNVKEGLSRRDRELIAVVVSQANDCRYCIEHHAVALAKYDPELADALVEDGWANVLEDDRDLGLATFAENMTLDPPSIDHEETYQGLRDLGLKDTAILQTVLTAAYFNYVNRLALAAGIQPHDLDRDYAH